jgi:hypothetical protein
MCFRRHRFGQTEPVTYFDFAVRLRLYAVYMGGLLSRKTFYVPCPGLERGPKTGFSGVQFFKNRAKSVLKMQISEKRIRQGDSPFKTTSDRLVCKSVSQTV